MIKFFWWFLIASIIGAIAVFIKGLIIADIILIIIGVILIGILIITLWGFDGYINTGVWFG